MQPKEIFYISWFLYLSGWFQGFPDGFLRWTASYLNREGPAKKRLLAVIDSESNKGVNLAKKTLRVLRKAHINDNKLASEGLNVFLHSLGKFKINSLS